MSASGNNVSEASRYDRQGQAMLSATAITSERPRYHPPALETGNIPVILRH